MTIRICIDLLPHCGHEEFDATCLWCADAQRVSREFRKSLEHNNQYNLPTKMIIVNYEDSSGYASN